MFKSKNRKLLELILLKLDCIERVLNKMATTVQDFQAQATALLNQNATDIASFDTVEKGVEALLQAQNQSLATLKQQVTDLQTQLAGTGTDVTVLQPILDTLTAQIAANEATKAKLVASVVANTPAQA